MSVWIRKRLEHSMLTPSLEAGTIKANNSPQLAAGTLLMGNPKGASVPFAIF